MGGLIDFVTAGRGGWLRKNRRQVDGNTTLLPIWEVGLCVTDCIVWRQGIRASRNGDAAAECLSRLQAAAASSSREPNLLTLAVDAARARCTVGEISDALEAAWGRHQATGTIVAGVYGKSRDHGTPGGGDGQDDDFRQALQAAGAPHDCTFP